MFKNVKVVLLETKYLSLVTLLIRFFFNARSEAVLIRNESLFSIKSQNSLACSCLLGIGELKSSTIFDMLIIEI